jgi:uridine phosphorylase
MGHHTEPVRAAGGAGITLPGVAYPNFPDKHGHDAIAEPAAFHRYWVDHGVLPEEYQAPEGVILLYQGFLVDAVLAGKLGPVSPFAAGARRSAFMRLHTFDDTGGSVGVIGGFGIGAPAATAIMEMMGALGVRRFVGVGTAGALQPHLETGAVVVCDRAVRDEGVSHHYLPPERWAHPTHDLTERLGAELDMAGCEPTTGAAWTIDAPFRETVAEARHYAEEGVAVVEMEASALFTVARCRGFEVASAFTVSDSLAGGEWSPQFNDPRIAASLVRMVHAAVATLQGAQG